MRNLFLFLVFCFSLQNICAQTNVSEFEYWFDNNYVDKIFEAISNPQPSVTIIELVDASSVSPGLHTLNFRSRDDSGRWSVTLSQFFQKLPDTGINNITKYEYWTDHDWQNAVSITLTQPGNSIQTIDSLDFSTLSEGLHVFRVRYSQTDGKWSSVLSQYFQKLPPENANLITDYEYWIDDAWQNKVSVNISQPASSIQTIDSLDFSDLSEGLHVLRIRYKQTDGNWSATLSQFIQKLPGEAEPSLITAYRYWTSDQDSLISTVELPNPVKDFEQLINANLLDLTTGDKEFNIQFRDSKGKWSSPLSDSVVNVGYPHLDAIVPNEGGNIGDVTATLYGGFFEGTEVMLVNGTGDTIHAPDSLIYINSGTDHFLATFDLRDKPLGFYDVVVTISSDTVMKLLNGFEVVAGMEAEPYVNLVGFNTIRPNTWQQYTLSYGNSGNVDAVGVPLWLAISEEAEVELAFEIYYPQDSFISYDTMPQFVIVDSVLEKPFNAKTYLLYIPRINAGESGTLNFNVKTTGTAIEIKTWVNQPLFGSPLDPIFGECMGGFLSLAVEQAFEVVPVVSCVYSTAELFLTIYEDNFINEETPTEKRWANFGWAFLDAGLECGQLLFPPVAVLDLINDALVVRDFFETVNTCVDPLSEQSLNNSQVNVVVSYDPNDKIGPIGNGSQNFYNGSQDFPYIIHFENADSATAAAQTVTIIDTLDQNVFDLNTLQLGFISFNDTIINLPAGLNSHETLVDMRPKANLIVEVKANLDQSTGILSWSFKTLDPITLVPTLDPLLGFLPPNLTAPEGEGSVFFTVKVKENLPLGTLIENDAWICFDNNPCIVTNEWSNTLDNALPQSAVNGLPSITYDTTFLVSWSGIDAGSGIMHYAVFVSTNGGDFKPWIVNSTFTSQSFTGILDSTYSFYSIATDSAGNKEAAPTLPDATTLIGLPTWLTYAELSSGCNLFPNPNDGNFNLSLLNPKKESISVSVFNAYGTLVKIEEFKAAGSKQILPITIGEIPEGVYFVNVQVGSTVMHKKVVFQNTY